MTCDCIRLQQLLLKSNNETADIMETFRAISEFQLEPEDAQEHYFEVRMTGVPKESGLLDESGVIQYLAETAPVDFDSQKFPQASKIRQFFDEKVFRYLVIVFCVVPEGNRFISRIPAVSLPESKNAQRARISFEM